MVEGLIGIVPYRSNVLFQLNRSILVGDILGDSHREGDQVVTIEILPIHPDGIDSPIVIAGVVADPIGGVIAGGVDSYLEFIFADLGDTSLLLYALEDVEELGDAWCFLGWGATIQFGEGSFDKPGRAG